jgi:uncharacterized membrane protein YhhN
MSYSLLLISVSIAALDWLAVWKYWRWLEFLAKPGVMLALLGWLLIAGGWQGQMFWFALGLLFSLAGDVFLMLPQERFITGLASFLLAHLAYVIGLNAAPPPLTLAALAVALLVGITAFKVYPYLAAGLEAQGTGELKAPVLAYTTVISLMLFSALLTLVRPDGEWQPLPSLLVSAGALLFFISDLLLGWNKCVAPLPNVRIKVMVAYHLGQFGIILGATLNYLAS